MPPPPVIEQPEAANGRFTFRWQIQAGKMYRMLFKSRLSDPDWTDLTGPSASGEFSAPLDGSAQGFYRVRIEP